MWKGEMLVWLPALRVSLKRFYGITPGEEKSTSPSKHWHVSTAPMTSLTRVNGMELGLAVCLFYLSTQYFTLRLPFVKTTLCLFKASVNFRKFLQRTVTTLSIACCQVPAPCPKALRSFHQIHQGEQLLGTSHHLNNRACIIRKDYIMPNITVVRVDFGIPQIVCIHAVFLLLNSSLGAYPTLCWKYSVIDTRCETHDAWQVASLSPGKMETSSGIPTSVGQIHVIFIRMQFTVNLKG